MRGRSIADLKPHRPLAIALCILLSGVAAASAQTLRAVTADRVILDGATGSKIAAHLGREDRSVALRTFAQGLSGNIGRRYGWRNTRTGNFGFFRASWEFHDDKLLCRDFTVEIHAEGNTRIDQGTACLQSDGKWHLR